MSNNYPDMATDLTTSIARLREGIPKTRKGFSAMGGGPSMVYAAQALDAYDQFAKK